MEQIQKDIYSVGVNDHDIQLFEGQFDVTRGMSYNSYAIVDDKVCIMDAVEKGFTKEWLNNVRAALNGRTPDYIVIQHMEPDHASGLNDFLTEYPDAVVVSNEKSFAIMKQFQMPVEKFLAVKEGDVLDLGTHKLSFVFAPMVHWPEVMFTYDSTSQALFSADAFGKFGANDIEDPEGWACEARRYYFGIVGKFGAQVQTVLKKAANLTISAICPLHGPVLKENLSYYLETYQTWSSYQPESKGVFIAYTSVYGNTEEVAKDLQKTLQEKGVKVSVADLARDDFYECIEDAFRYDRLVLATTTYNGGIFPKMANFIDALIERNYQNRTVGLIENGSWAPVAAKAIRAKFEKSKNLTLLDEQVTVRSAANAETKAQVVALAEALTK